MNTIINSKLIYGLFITLFLMGFIYPAFLSGSLGLSASATTQETVEAPSFPACSVPPTTGDWVTSENGDHHIPGQEATINGSDDVYQLEDGNFVQCLCASNTQETDYRTLWWNISQLDLSDSQLDALKAQGWIEEAGLNWNLLDAPYLAKNDTFECSPETPTPTPTPPVGGPSSCTALSITPSDGTIPLSVKFNGVGDDPEGDIQEYEFNFGDSSHGQSQVVTQTGNEATHVYHNAGSFVATLKVKDSKGNWRSNDSCSQEIKVHDRPTVITSDPITELPKTGFAGLATLGLFPVIFGGIKVYRRFRLV